MELVFMMGLGGGGDEGTELSESIRGFCILTESCSPPEKLESSDPDLSSPVLSKLWDLATSGALGSILLPTDIR